MKKIVIILFALLLAAPVFSQKDKKKAPNLPSFDQKKLHFGFLIGFNTLDFRVMNAGMPVPWGEQPENQKTYYADVLTLKPGLNIGIVSDLRLNRHFNLRFLPGISFGQRDLSYYEVKNGKVIYEENSPLKIKSTFLEFPLIVKFSGKRMHNAKPFITAGGNTRYDLAKNKQDHLLLRSLDFYAEAGAGFDFYMTYFRFSVELKASIGFANMLNPDGTQESGDEIYTQALDALKSRVFSLTFYFE